MIGRFMIITGIIALVVGIPIIILAGIPDTAEMIAAPFCENIENDGFTVQCNDGEEPVNVTDLLMMVGVALTVGGSLDLAFGFVVGIAGISSKLNRIVKMGEPAQAMIIAVDRTGVTVNDQPMLKFTLRVQPNYGQAYEAETRRIIPYHMMPYFVLGMTVPVKYMPDKPEDVALDLDNMTFNPTNIAGSMIGANMMSASAKTDASDLSERLKELQESYDQGLITQEEYEDARKRILGSF